jgi:ferritin
MDYGKDNTMISNKMQKSINDQINFEYSSSYLYLAMAGYFETINLKGFANWMRVQAQEELVHSMKFYNFLVDRRGKIELGAIAKPPVEWKSPLDVFEAALGHEEKVTARINNLADLAITEKDHATHSFLKWFVDEQVEEESAADGVIQKLKLAKNSADSLFMIDKELAARVFVPLAATGNTGTELA